jgi:beta-galactosidase beta subunit
MIISHSTTHTTYAELAAVSLHKLYIKIHKYTKNKQRMKAATEGQQKERKKQDKNKDRCWCTP